MSVLISVDPGSTHMSKITYMLELMNIAASEGADVFKVQLFNKDHPGIKQGNIMTPLEWWPGLEKQAQEKKILLAASFFDKSSFEFAFEKRLEYMKFAYSMQDKHEWIKSCLTIGKTVIVSSDWMNHQSLPDGVKKLYCHTRLNTCTGKWEPQYPVAETLNFYPLFPPFDGFSDHTIGWNQAEQAVLMGAKYIEKHLTLTYNDITCPDAKFALKPKELGRMVNSIRRIQL
jgi:sialic acid synthase SpsE